MIRLFCTKSLILIFIALLIQSTAGQNYTYKKGTADGIGKIYQGREISKVMGHFGAPWLERSSRESEENPTLAVDLLQLTKKMVVVDFGAGSGYFTSKLAKQCSIVYAVDVQKEMLDLNASQMKKKGIGNVKYILGDVSSTNLPKNTFDLFLLV
ncbi:MAG: class I SAM-dependent methyltransferase, partial [Candidatus Neomarinimicrobiota bacterium]|nr:class I SAM-dependent methyltransferase [Candidatus Neomarinimicrobiota bacterium]